MAVGGSHDNYNELISAGKLDTHEVVFLSSNTEDVTNTFTTINPESRTDITFPAAAIQIKVSSTNVNDTAAGTGARTVLMRGLDENYEAITEVVTLNGQTAATTTQSFLRVNKVFVATAGTTERNEGIIYFGTGTVTSGVPATKYTYCQVGMGTNHVGMFTVPAGRQLFISNIHSSVGQDTANNNIAIRLSTRTPGTAWVSNGVGFLRGAVRQVLNPFFALDEKTDILVEVKDGSATVGASNLITGYLRDITLGG